MKKYQKLFVLILMVFTFASGNVNGQYENAGCEGYKDIIGEWISEPYEIGGISYIDEVKYYMVHNDQYLALDVTVREDKGKAYTGTGYFSIDKDGNIQGWIFDVRGADMMTTYTGKCEADKITLYSKNPQSTATGEIRIEDDVIYETWTINLKSKNGDDISLTMDKVYRRKNTD
jgi:hypothetical protein